MLLSSMIFIILNVLFLSILILFLAKQSNNTKIVEENYAKEISLIVDSAKPSMLINLDMTNAKKIIEKNNLDFKNAVIISGNNILIKLDEKTGYTYSFFNKVDVLAYPDVDENNEYTGMYVFTINSLGGLNE